MTPVASGRIQPKLKFVTLTQNTGSGSVVSLNDSINNKKPILYYANGFKLELYLSAVGNVWFDVRKPNTDEKVLNTDITFTVGYL